MQREGEKCHIDQVELAWIVFKKAKLASTSTTCGQERRV
jgi:hypothetical protein